MSTLTARPAVSVRPIRLEAPERGEALLVHLTAPTSGQGLPVIVFSHGYGAFGASMETYRPLVDHWVDQGFVVIQPNHLDAQGLAPEDPRSEDLWRIRIHDLIRTLDQLDTALAAVPGLRDRVNRDQIAIAGHSYGATTASALLGARVLDAAGNPSATFKDPRVKAGVLLALTGTGGENLSPFAQQNFSFMNPDFTELTTPTLVIAGSADQSPLTVRGPDWFTDGYHLAPGATDLLALTGAEHSLGGINGYHDTHTTDENPRHVHLIRHASTAYLRSALAGIDDAWNQFRTDHSNDSELSMLSSK
jgi:dienelactone hydrolase